MEAFECGTVVNPNGLRNQIEGAIMMGIGGALFEEVRFAAGRILNSHFSEYRVPRFKDMPVWSKISNALKRLGFRSHNFSRATFYQALDSSYSDSSTLKWNDFGRHPNSAEDDR